MIKGLRFQTRLLLAFLFATSLVSFLVIRLTSARVETAYQKQFQNRFDQHIRYLLHSRDQRSEQQVSLAARLARTSFIVNQLVPGAAPDSFRKEFESLLPEDKAFPGASLPRNPLALQPTKLPRIFAVMNLEGEIIPLLNQSSKSQARGPRKTSLQTRLETLKQAGGQQVVYLPFKGPDERGILREFVITPVKNPANGAIIGAFLMSINALGETEAERVIGRYTEAVDGEAFENAVYYDGKLYESATPLVGRRTSSEDGSPLLAELEEATRKQFESRQAEGQEGNFVARLRGEPHMVHYRALNPDSPAGIAWQISAFSMAALKKDLHDLKIMGGGIGLMGTLLGWLISLLISRRLAIPIRELAEGTRKIRAGRLDAELPVRSRDEIGELTQSFNEMTAELRQKELYRQILEKVSDESVAQAMIEGVLHPALGGELKEVSVLFCDIREFTSLTESMPPAAVIEFLNHHMTAMTRVVREHFGVVDKFVGDEIMAVFGGLKSYGNDASNAARCALKMMSERERLNREHAPPVSIGIGIATGEVVAGCMGSSDRLNYTVLGAKVNLAARLCGQAKAGEVIIDDATREKLNGEEIHAEAFSGLQLKGFTSGITAWKLSGKRPPVLVVQDTSVSSG